MDNKNHSFKKKNRAELKVLKGIIKNRCDNYSARFFGLIAPSIFFPLANGVSDAMGHSLVDQPSRDIIYAGGIAIHQLRKRPDIPSNFKPRSLSDSIISLSLTDGILLTGVSYGIGYTIGAITYKVNNFF
jgi:hypothetical protein